MQPPPPTPRAGKAKMHESGTKSFSAVQNVKEQESDSPIQYFSSQHWKRARVHALSISRNPADAEDIAQETYVRLFQAFVAGGKIEHCTAWMKGVMRRVIVDHFRKVRPDLHVSF